MKAKPKKSKETRGRKTKYRPEYVRQVALLCERFGALDAEIAAFLGCSVSTLNNWKREHPEFLESLKAAKAAWDGAQLDESIMRCACGFTYTEEVWDPKNKEVVRLQKVYLPSYKHQMALKANRDRTWRIPYFGPPRPGAPGEGVAAAAPAALSEEERPGYQRLAREILAEHYQTRLNLPDLPERN